MVRQRAKDRLPQLVEAAVEVFREKGYKAAQMADIARAMDVSEAALYRYVESKEALFRLVVRHSLLQQALPDEELPLASPPLEVTLKEIRDAVGDANPVGLRTALRRRRVADPEAELAGIVRELFELTALTRKATDIIERSATDVPAFARLMETDLRRPLLEGLTLYLRRRSDDGYLRRTPDAAATARLVLETIVWFARHRFSDPDGAAISDQLAQETVVDVLVHALSEAGKGGRR